MGKLRDDGKIILQRSAAEVGSADKRVVHISGDYVRGDKVGQDKYEGFQPSPPLYFRLMVLDTASNNGKPLLKPNKRYRVKVWATKNPGKDQEYIIVESPFLLRLEVLGEITPQYITIPDPERHSLTEQAQKFKSEFELVTDTQLPYGQVTIALKYWPENEAWQEECVTSQKFDLEGSINPDDQGLLIKCHVDLSVKRPSKTAIIHIKNADIAGQIQLICWGYYANRTLQTDSFKPPEVSLAGFIEDDVAPKKILNKLRAFFVSNPDLGLIAWIKFLRQRLGEEMQLVVVDHTDTEIPWEMLELKDNVYLGAIVPVVRWLPVPYYDEYIHMHVTSKKCVGQVIAYLDEQELPHAVKERQQLSYFLTQFCTDIEEFYNKLEKPLSETGLVYLACHGIFATDSDKIEYGSWRNPSNRIIPLQLEDLPYCESERPILFVNACHSARVKWLDESLYGLPVVMLRRVASGYIGTLGPVNSDLASKVSSDILESIRNAAEGVQLIESLRIMRANAAQQLIADRQSKLNQLRFIFTYMYVYYGNPLAHLQLLPSQEIKDGNE